MKIDSANVIVFKAITKVAIAITLLVAGYFGARSIWHRLDYAQDFQIECEVKCHPRAAITPIINGDESCLCSVGQGVWRKW